MEGERGDRKGWGGKGKREERREEGKERKREGKRERDGGSETTAALRHVFMTPVRHFQPVSALERNRTTTLLITREI